VNKSLYGKVFNVPNEILMVLSQAMKSYGNNTTSDGYQRCKSILSNGTVTYQQLKRIKNFFDSYNGNENDVVFILNGGNPMKNWVNDFLRQQRDSIETTKKNRTNAGFENQYNSPHYRDNLSNMNRTTTSHRTRSVLNQEILKINLLMRKIL